MSIASERLPGTDDRPPYARRDHKGFYTWAGETLPSVTTILGSAPGQHLMSWYGKQASLKAASHLVQAGFPVPENDEVLQEFCEALVPRRLSVEQAAREVLAWSTVMREAERYRDHKSRIGSITHHAIYEHATGIRIDRKDVEDYCRYQAIQLRLWRDSHGPLFEPTEAMVCEVARSAVAYVLSAFDFIEAARPDWNMIGQEACVVRPDHDDGLGYAGTVDAIAKFHRSTWDALTDAYFRAIVGEWVWPGSEADLTLDFKTSNSLPRSVQAQLEAYANADFIGYMATGETLPVPSTNGIAALHIGPHPSLATVADEFGVLESKAKVTGARLLSWPRSPETYEAFLGLVRWFRWTEDVPRAQQQKARQAAEPKPTKFDRRPAPFGGAR